MNNSAESLREQRKRETARALTDAARRLTADHGFAGFTVEDVCAEAGVSRRTFFNYFESKDNAVFGFTAIDSRQEQLEAEFIDAGGDLLDDFVALSIRRFEVFNPIDDVAAVFELIDQEPRLLKSLFEQLGKSERRDIALVERRMGGAPDADLRATVLVHTVGALVRLSMEQLVHHHSPDSFRDLVTRRLEFARSAFTPSQKAD